MEEPGQPTNKITNNGKAFAFTSIAQLSEQLKKEKELNKYENLRLREREITPTYEVLEKILGDNFGAYEIFQDELAGLELEQEWKFYKDGCSWLARGQYRWTTTRGTEKEKTIYWLSVWEKYFKVTIWFLEKNRYEVIKAGVSEETKQKILDSKTLGKLKTFPVEFDVITTDKFLTDIYSLIRCKKKLEAK